ncbi:Vascular endothelial growth factor D [Calypte anna]|uniref:Vascular endothelial growth factor D n=1 Tax=Calypte anna TaxID=9244 RepID=A0A091HZ68_CALAN|nr:Vascular endothelial growth factor D [Calypte anna]
MFKPWATVNIFIVSFLHLLQGSDYENGSVKRTSLSALERSEQQIRRASSLEELLRITHSEDWKLWKCRLKLKSLANLDSRSASHRSTRFAAAFYDIDTLKGCYKVSLEPPLLQTEQPQLPQSVFTRKVLQPSDNFSVSPVDTFQELCVLIVLGTPELDTELQLFEIAVPLTSVPEPVPVKIANHTGCKCLSNTQRHQYTIIRRSVQYPEEDGCPFTNKLCHNGWIWDSDKCECVIDVEHTNRREGLPPLAELAMCGQYMEFDEENCECVCRQKCPTDFFQSKENCSCYLCRESQESCALKHKIFHAETCSCEDKCPPQPRTCPTAKPTCSRHCRCPKEKRGSHGSQSKETP